MASTRSPSPALGNASPEPLTPRTKIKALLAAVDSSEDEATPSNGKKITKRLSPPLLQSRSPTNYAASSQHTKQDASSDEDESDVDIRPRGRLAARMHATVQKTTTDVPEQSEPLGTSQTPNEGMDNSVSTSLDHESEKDDDLPVAPRRLQRRAPEADAKSVNLAARSTSPGLFVSSPVRPSPTKTVEHNSDSENDLPALKSDRFKALVARKRQQIMARDAAEEARKAELRAEREKMASELEELVSDEGNVSDIIDDEGGRKLTQEARPTRKASKKAIEEMNRETQRMARSMQLAHEAKTRKKISKSSLFERFNYRPAGEVAPPATSSSRPASPQTDVEMKDPQTPPSSPPLVEKPKSTEGGEALQPVLVMDDDDDKDLPTVDALVTLSQAKKLDKGKGKEVVRVVDEVASKPKRQVRVKFSQLAANHALVISDDELEITHTSKRKLDAVFRNIPTRNCQEAHSIQTLRALAQLKSPGKKTSRRQEQSGMSAGELQTYLQQKARQQAKLEREHRLNSLKAQGVVVQTAEERERQMQEVEDIVAKAREEAEQIMALEKAEAKQDKDGQAKDPLAWDDSDDEEYQASADEDDDAVEVELSGSEDEDEDGQEENEQRNSMLDDVAEDASDASGEQSAQEDEEMADDDIISTPKATRRPRKHVPIVSDDEDEDEIAATPRPQPFLQATPRVQSTTTPKISSVTTPGAPSSVLRSAKKNFIPGFPVQGPAGLGLTQMFAGTMDDSQVIPGSGPTQSMLPDFDHFPDSNFSAMVEEREDSVAPDSQDVETQATTQGVQLNLAQSQMHGFDSLLRDMPNTQMSDIIEFSQDGGLQDHTPMKERFVDAPASTVDTVLVDPEDALHDSPLVRRGRLRRKLVLETTDEDPAENAASSPTAFNVLKDAALKEKKQKLVEEFNRKKSKAKEMVHEQADESEDEYQGLGGYDGEDSDDGSVASVKDMIDDAARSNVDESKLAAFYADRERANDEQQVQKLFKDITSGMLRRKRGADYDLSDSDDGGEARQRRKRQQFAKMQKALYADERVKKIAENPGNQAFLRTIQDHASDDDMDFLDAAEEAVREDSQSQSQLGQDDVSRPQEVVPDSQPRTALGAAPDNRAPVNPRRTKGGKKPANIGEVRETLSNLLDEGREMSVIPATEAGSDSEEGEEEVTSSARSDKENHEPNSRRGKQMVVDRITLKRNSSSTMSKTDPSRLAFSAQSSSSSFKVPALLRRATTNSFKSGSSSSSTSNSSTGVSTPTHGGGSAGGFGDDAKIKKAAGKRSGINAFAREGERRAQLAESERRRQEKKVRGAERRIGVVGGLLGKGSFE